MSIQLTMSQLRRLHKLLLLAFAFCDPGDLVLNGGYNLSQEFDIEANDTILQTINLNQAIKPYPVDWDGRQAYQVMKNCLNKTDCKRIMF